MQSIDPQVTLPYWNWGLGELSETTALFQDDRIGPMGSGGASGRDEALGITMQDLTVSAGSLW